jgi:hypothetical protein
MTEKGCLLTDTILPFQRKNYSVKPNENKTNIQITEQLIKTLLPPVAIKSLNPSANN